MNFKKEEEAMRRFLFVVLGLSLVFVSCIRIEEYEIVRYKAPNWTSDGRIVFVEDYNFVRDKHTWTGTEGNIEGGKEILTLCEIDRDGKNLKQIVELAENPDYAYSLGITNTSSAGDLVAVAMRTEDSDHDEVFVVKRDGTGLKNLCEGTWPDLSPDGKKIVYQKPNQGLWIKNIDGSGDRQILQEGKGIYPAWSSDGERIAFVCGNLYIMDTIGSLVDSILIRTRGNPPDWGPLDSNAIAISNVYIYPPGEYHASVIYLESADVDTVWNFKTGNRIYWAPNGVYFISSDSVGYFVIERDGANKWYLKP